MRKAFQRSFGERLEKTSRTPARLAARSDIEKFSIFDLASGKAVAKVALPTPLSFGARGNLLLAAGMLNNSSFAVTIVDVPTAEVVREFLTGLAECEGGARQRIRELAREPKMRIGDGTWTRDDLHER